MQSHEYDDDIFTLKEDELQKHRSHVIQYALVSAFAVTVIAVALYMSWWLTERRIEYQSSIPGAEAQEDTLEDEALNIWPSELFPNVPQIQASEYQTRLSDYRAEVRVPMAAASSFTAYADRLADDGAQVFVRIPRLTVLSYRGVEIHLISSAGYNAVVLCGEPRLTWNDSDYAEFPLPQKGMLVLVGEGTGEGSKVLTYRQLSATDAINYASSLTQSGWSIVGSLEPEDHIFSCSFKKGDKQIAVDYFSASDNCRVKLDFIR